METDETEAAVGASFDVWRTIARAWVRFLRTPGITVSPQDYEKIARLLDEAEPPGTGAAMLRRGYNAKTRS